MLSTTSIAPASRAAWARARMSAMFSSGLVGVSVQIIRTGRAASCSRTAVRSDMGTTLWLSPQPDSTRANRRYVPP